MSSSWSWSCATVLCRSLKTGSCFRCCILCMVAVDGCGRPVQSMVLQLKKPSWSFNTTHGRGLVAQPYNNSKSWFRIILGLGLDTKCMVVVLQSIQIVDFIHTPSLQSCNTTVVLVHNPGSQSCNTTHDRGLTTESMAVLLLQFWGRRKYTIPTFLKLCQHNIKIHDSMHLWQMTQV